MRMKIKIGKTLNHVFPFTDFILFIMEVRKNLANFRREKERIWPNSKIHYFPNFAGLE